MIMGVMSHDVVSSLFSSYSRCVMTGRPGGSPTSTVVTVSTVLSWAGGPETTDCLIGVDEWP